MKQQLLELIEEKAKSISNTPYHNKTFLSGAEYALTSPDILEAAGLVKEEWVSVEDRLPDIDKWVLLNNGYWTGVGKYTPHEDNGEPEWQDETSEYINPYPTHWKPLPSPPKTNNQ